MEPSSLDVPEAAAGAAVGLEIADIFEKKLRPDDKIAPDGSYRDRESQPCVSGPGTGRRRKDSFRIKYSILTMKERRPATRTLRDWAISVLREAGAIRECEEHGWMQDRADPHVRERAFDVARRDPPPGLSPDAGAVEVREVLDSIGDTCPECPP